MNDPRPSLVIGGSGFLGPHVVAALVQRARALATMADPHGPPVLSAARRPEDGPSFCQPRDAAQARELDLLDAGATTRLLDAERPGAVFLCAALSRWAECEADPDRARALNVDAPARVAAWCREHGARLVHVSTDLVFGREPAPQGGFAEDAPPDPVGVYGDTKAAGERAVLAAHPEALVVRLPLLYGNSGGRGLGASDSVLEAVERGERPGLFTDEWRTPLEVSQAGEALAELGETALTGILHVAGPERVSRHRLGVELLLAMGLDADAAEAALRATTRAAEGMGERPEDVALDASRARAALALRPAGLARGMALACGA